MNFTRNLYTKNFTRKLYTKLYTEKKTLHETLHEKKNFTRIDIIIQTISEIRLRWRIAKRKK
jgi:hypothetical protein